MTVLTSAQAATPSAADAAKRADLVRRLGNIIAGGVAGYTGLRAEVPQTTLLILTPVLPPPLGPGPHAGPTPDFARDLGQLWASTFLHHESSVVLLAGLWVLRERLLHTFR